MTFEPLRGPANVTHLPLNPAPLAVRAAGGGKTGVKAWRKDVRA